MNKDIKKLKYYKEYGLIMTCEKCYVPPLYTEIDLLFHTLNKNNPTKKQLNILNMFMDINIDEINKVIIGINNLMDKLIKDKIIVKTSKKINNINELHFDNIILPYQNKTKNKYLLIYATTNWKIMHSKFTIEVEILFKNNKFMFVQEHSGLWTRLEWDYEYNKK
jgi:hypothetical protein